MNKYGNRKTVVGGYAFDSIAEARRYQELKILEKAGEIFNLELQPKFVLVPKTKTRRAVTYTADFRYYEPCGRCFPDKDNCPCTDSRDIVEDVKSPATAKDKAYIIKRNLFEYQNPNIEFKEVVAI